MRTRIIIGNLLAAFTIALLIGDRYLDPWFPILFVALGFIGVVATRELLTLFPAVIRPDWRLAVGGVLLVMVANWVPRLTGAVSWSEAVLGAFVVVLLVAILVEMARFREPGGIVPRLGLVVFAAAYLGLLGSVFAQLRWVTPDAYRSSWLLALAIFIPKGADTGAYFAGRAFGRHKMSPVLSPKKTWEGLVGGLAWSAATAAGFDYLAGGLFGAGIMEAVAFGIVVGAVGVLGDLAESLIKRDGGAKDAANRIPEFGGLLDVVDSVLFAAPVAYLWFALSQHLNPAR
ncbi:phosphatidate cytidylyltransferase [Urbifossiella limnaea]|uniref:Phosphatidate cytidylyltransferase n=1 Tax=Urbifossiella limnaea TaxID=2528023 RepID=A0A517XTT7_9BACT|nr:phosphatidate cytidylyltransferase [Urbifossiella limnaea]QDU20918.1 Phosphatidate cytidylyltransferase [Urbifossiella limnaea]